MLAVTRALGCQARLAAPAAMMVSRSYAAAGSGTVVELQTDEEYQAALKELTTSKGGAIVDFSAVWCGPCKMIAPVFDGLAKEFPSVRFYKIDIDNKAISTAVTENSVAAVPTFVGYQGPDRITAFSGADTAMLRRLALELSGGHTKTPGQ
ncbi:thioredoxin o [Micractinium conductrix]|uniref:Thioredoxin o n=1 Tax=Micractinium conductrix TaxID=554055 RepID=A0A2P6VMQ1_9CHLO|nr:thioredoxin o [Micractinium conductrix]|eukprot:PSC75337.1 thioredoxin o [Micractinium conductrix]